MIVGAEHQARHMGNRHTNERHRTAISGSHGSQEARDYQKPIAHTPDPHPEIAGIAIAEEKEIERFDKSQ